MDKEGFLTFLSDHLTQGLVSACPDQEDEVYKKQQKQELEEVALRAFKFSHSEWSIAQ